MNVTSLHRGDRTGRDLVALTLWASRVVPYRRTTRYRSAGTAIARPPPDRRGAYRSVVNTPQRYRISFPDDSPHARS
jgi:hypothetical protein